MRTATTRMRHDPVTGPVQAGLIRRPWPVQAKAGQPGMAYQDRPEGEAERPSRLGASFGDITVFPKPGTSASDSTGLPAPLRKKMESAFHADFSDVRVHPDAPRADSLSALAFTQGRDLHFAPGQYNPVSQEGQQVIAHELAHVVQQRAGRVSVPESGAEPVNASPSLEAEADVLGAKAVQGQPVKAPGHRRETGTTGAAPIQGMMSRGGGRGSGPVPVLDEEFDEGPGLGFDPEEMVSNLVDEPDEVPESGSSPQTAPTAPVVRPPAPKAEDLQREIASRNTRRQAKINSVLSQSSFSNRPKKPDSLKGTDESGEALTAHHMLPHSRIKSEFSSVVGRQDLTGVTNLMAFAGEEGDTSEAYRKLAYYQQPARGPRGDLTQQNLSRLYNKASWDERNVFMGPSPDLRSDDPGNSRVDVRYTGSGAPSRASGLAQEVWDKGFGGLDMTPGEYQVSLRQARSEASGLRPYNKDDWEESGETTRSGKKKVRQRRR